MFVSVCLCMWIMCVRVCAFVCAECVCIGGDLFIAFGSPGSQVNGVFASLACLIS